MVVPETTKVYSSSIDSHNEAREEGNRVLCNKENRELALATKSNFKKFQGVLVGELTKQRLLKEKERAKAYQMAQYNSDLADVVACPLESNKKDRDL